MQIFIVSFGFCLPLYQHESQDFAAFWRSEGSLVVYYTGNEMNKKESKQ